MQNIEFKAELNDLDAARAQCRVACAFPVSSCQQTDTYYRMPDGRLKRREVPGEPVEWVYYHRQDRLGTRLSNYSILSEEQARARWGVQSLREWLTVVKQREIWQMENVAIHLDDVERLGSFIEFEALVTPEAPVELCHLRVHDLRELFSTVITEAVSMSYCDLMEQALQLGAAR